MHLLHPVLFGFVLEKAGMQKFVKNVRLKAGSDETSENKRAWSLKRKLKEAFASAWGSLRPIMGYLLIGVSTRCWHLWIYAAGFRNENRRTG